VPIGACFAARTSLSGFFQQRVHAAQILSPALSVAVLMPGFILRHKMWCNEGSRIEFISPSRSGPDAPPGLIGAPKIFPFFGPTRNLMLPVLVLRFALVLRVLATIKPLLLWFGGILSHAQKVFDEMCMRQ
jgi:hypothetical protein